MVFSKEDKDKINDIQRSVWIPPEEFRKKLIENEGIGVKLQLKGEKNRYVTISDVSEDQVKLTDYNGKTITVALSEIGGFTTITDWYRQRKTKK